MALKFDEYIFFHIPRCGGNYVRRLIDEFDSQNKMGMEKEELVAPHAHALSIPLPAMLGTVTFCVVRDPLSWYQSYYGYRLIKKKGWRDEPLDICCRSAHFPTFVNKALFYFNGFYTRTLAMVVPYVDFVIPLSQLARGMRQILEPLMYDYNHVMPDFINFTDHNTSSEAKFNRSLPQKVTKRFDKIEYQPFKRLLMQHQRKFWFQDEAGKEFGFNAKGWIHAEG